MWSDYFRNYRRTAQIFQSALRRVQQHRCADGGKTGRVYIQWSVDALDYPEDATPDSIYRRATEKINSGDIILMHNGTKYTAKVLPRILENLTRRFELSSLSELLYDDYVLDSAGMMIKK